MKRIFLVISLLFFASLSFAQTRNLKLVKAPTENPTNQKRKAMVIGMGDYGGNKSLDNTLNDADDMAGVLTRLGFEVTLLKNNDLRNLRTNLTNWYNSIEGNDMAIFYFAGHGMEVAGQNYLVPIDAELNSQTDAQYNTLNVNQVLDNMDERRVGMKLIILDACRDNPFKRSWSRGSEGKGLAQMRAPTGTYIAYAAAPGFTAADGGNYKLNNGVFTHYLKQEIVKEGLSIENIFTNVTRSVYNHTDKKQTPFRNSSLTDNFYFVPPATTLTVSLKELSFPVSGGTESVSVTTNAEKYDVASLPNWCSVINKLPDSFSIQCDSWNGNSPRKGYFEVKVDGKSERILVEQSSKPITTLTVSLKELSFPVSGGTESVSVTTNAEKYDVTSLPSWCSVINKLSDSFSIQCDSWDGSSPRKGYFEVKADDKSERIQVEQSSKPVTTLTVSSNELSFPALGGAESVSVITNAEKYDVTSLPDWCLVISKNANDFLFQCNSWDGSFPRKGYFEVKAGDKSERILVEQGSKPATATATTLTVSAKELSFPALGGTESVSVTTNAEKYDVTSLPSWCSIINKLPDSFSIQCDSWNRKFSRKGYFDVKAGGKSERIIVMQSSKSVTTLTVSSKELSFPVSGGTESVSVTTNAEKYDVISLPNWCSVINKNANDFSIQCDSWNGSSPRKGYFDVKADGKSEKILVEQSSKPATTLTASSKELNFVFKGVDSSVKLFLDDQFIGETDSNKGFQLNYVDTKPGKHKLRAVWDKHEWKGTINTTTQTDFIFEYKRKKTGFGYESKFELVK